MHQTNICSFKNLELALNSNHTENRPEILSETVHNLLKSSDTSSLWMIDNESGLLDAYNLLDSRSSAKSARFQRMHSDTLQTLCVFRRSSGDKVFSLYKHGDMAVTLLEDLVTRNDPSDAEQRQNSSGQFSVHLAGQDHPSKLDALEINAQNIK